MRDLGLFPTGCSPLICTNYSYATDINNLGQVVGTATVNSLNDTSGQTTGFLWTAGTGMIRLPTLGLATNVPAAINNAGQIAGGLAFGSLNSHAYLLDGAGIRDIDTLGSVSSQATDLNDAGQVVGSASAVAGRPRPFRWTAEQGMEVLPLLMFGARGAANSINAAGQIVGWSEGTFSSRAVLWTSPTQVADLGTLGGTTARANGINTAGQVVGSSYDAQGYPRAFLWTPAGGMVDLNSLIAPGTGWLVTEANDINDGGQIVGVGFYNSREMAFLMTPLAPPSAPGVSLSPASLSFGQQTVGLPSAAGRVTLANSGNASLTITAVQVGGDAVNDFLGGSVTSCLGPGGAARILQPGLTCTADIVFTPATTGARTATLFFTTNAAGSPHAVPLSGAGIVEPPPASSPSPTATPTPPPGATSTPTATPTATPPPTVSAGATAAAPPSAAPTGGPGPAPIVGATTWYFAEGYTGPGFDEYLTIQNPNPTRADLTITYFLNGAPPAVRQVSVAGNSRYTVAVHDAREGVGRNQAVSAKVESTNGVGVVVERPMYFTYNGSTAGVTGGHTVMGVQQPRQAWLFGEGYTGAGFDQYLTIMNPNPAVAPVTITYYLGGGRAPVVKQLAVPASSRYTVTVHDSAEGVGRGQEVSAKVETGLAGGIVVERPIYFRYTGIAGGVTGGHTVMGAAGARPVWFFPDGATHPGWDTYLTLMNPAGQDSQVRLTYYVAGEAAPRTKELVAPRNGRTTVAVHDESQGVGRGKALGMRVETTNGVDLVVERPMYFRYGATINGGHDVMGAGAPRMTWLFAEGYTGAGFDQYLVVFNPNATAADVTVTYYLAGGAPVVRPLRVEGSSRAAVAVFDAGQVGRGQAVSAKVETAHPGGVVAERPIYFAYNGAIDGGHTVMGYAP
jgi:probable HAF family extracellular repeat protein